MHIRFGALTLNRSGLEHYGECSLAIRTAMIAHRVSLIAENSALFMKRHNYDAPAGFRAAWEGRHKLCVAKLVDAIDAGTKSSDFAGILLRPGITADEDQFVEAHIWGPLTIRSIGGVTVRQWACPPSAAELAGVKQKLAQYGVAFNEP